MGNGRVTKHSRNQTMNQTEQHRFHKDNGMASIQNLANASSGQIIHDESEGIININIDKNNNKISTQTFLTNKFGKRKRSH